ncbi:hypothetical protein [Massilia soli]|uniref:Uncharacterized protein n=1 Tax=Massilia soli TaxID=2792854 RepID=A0ABS7SQI0_9BURK|nr:hypothetical protein [Massilia soli]MBZ2208023.1 hypothetical protein [Massilia soli]
MVAPIDACRHEPETRTVGGQAFSRIGDYVYRVDRWERRQPGGPVCMIGVACFPLYERPRNETHLLLVRLEGPVDLARLRSYLDDRILSDGSAVFDSLQRVPPLSPTLNLAKLRAALPGALEPLHVTDGRWVIYGGRILHGADPSTLEAVLIAFIAPNDHARALRPIVRDRHAVFYGSQRIDGADPVTFMLFHYASDRLHPGGNLPDTGWIGLDGRNGWYLSDNAAEPLGLSTQRHRALLRELAQLRRQNQLEPLGPAAVD